MTSRKNQAINQRNGGDTAMKMENKGVEIAVAMLGALGVPSYSINSFINGEIPKSDHIHQYCRRNNISDEDRSVVEQLSLKGFTVYYVIHSAWLTDFELLQMTNYLYVPEDIFKAHGLDDVMMSDIERQAAIDDIIKNEISLAKHGFVMSFAVNNACGIQEHGEIKVALENGLLVRIG